MPPNVRCVLLLLITACGSSVASVEEPRDDSATGLGHGNPVHLRAWNGQFVVAELGGGADVNADRDGAGPWETFTVVDKNGGSFEDGDPIHLRCHDGVSYLMANEGGGYGLSARSSNEGDWETFTVRRIAGAGKIADGDSIALQAHSGHYVVAEEGGGSVVNANRQAVGPWETFTIYQEASSKSLEARQMRREVQVRAWNGQYLAAEQGGGDRVSANRDAAGPWETFTLVDLNGGGVQSGDAVQVLTHDAHYLVADRGGSLRATSNSAGESETFTLHRVGEGYAFQSVYGLYMVAEGGGGGVVNVDRAAVGPWETFKIDGLGSANRRNGRVRLSGKTVADDGGAFNAMGATMFWGLWGYKYDRARLEQNLEFLADNGFDYIRALGEVGPAHWTNRTIDPTWPGYDADIAAFTDLVYDVYGMRVQWSIFGGINISTTPTARAALIDRFLAMSRGREHKIIMFEVANEGDNNGLEGEEMRFLARRLKDNTDVLVAVTALRSSLERFCSWYAGDTADIATAHYERVFRSPDGVWRPVRQPWGYGDALCPSNEIPEAVANNEPIGPYSSVEEERDPLRLVMAAAVTFVAQNAMYVFHSGPGIRGGGIEDLNRGRPANFWEIQDIDRILEGFRAMRSYLPEGIAGWTRHNSQWSSHPFVRVAPEEERFVRNYASTSGSRLIVTTLGMENPVSFTTKRAMDLDAIDPITGRIVAHWSLAPNQSFTLPTAQGLVLSGTFR